MRRNRVGGGALYELMPRAFFQAAGGFFERLVFMEISFCIGKKTTVRIKREARAFPN